MQTRERRKSERRGKTEAAAREAVRGIGRLAARVRLNVKERRRRAREAAAAEVRERLTVKLPRTLIERARNAVFWTPGLTLTSLVESSLRSAIAALERARGTAFPQRERDLQAGRPKASATR